MFSLSCDYNSVACGQSRSRSYTQGVDRVVPGSNLDIRVIAVCNPPLSLDCAQARRGFAQAIHRFVHKAWERIFLQDLQEALGVAGGRPVGGRAEAGPSRRSSWSWGPQDRLQQRLTHVMAARLGA